MSKIKFHEELLHFVWKMKYFDHQELETTEGEKLEIIDFGYHNHDAGPDFLEAKIKIGTTIWAGHIEMHIHASDWYLHHHEQDKAYNNVILHVVYRDDKPVISAAGQPLKTLVLSDRIDRKFVLNYENLLVAKTWIPCQDQFQTVSDITKSMWLERLAIERLQSKTEVILEKLSKLENDWEGLLYHLLLQYFGFKVNAYPMQRLADQTPLAVVRKMETLAQMEALLFGQSDLLGIDDYSRKLKEEYKFIKHKYQLTSIQKVEWKFLRMRPPNFPTIRLAQLAVLFYKFPRMFSMLLEIDDPKEIKNMFSMTLGTYWDTHYQFDKVSTKRIKKLGAGSIDLIIINVVVPLLFSYGTLTHQERLRDRALLFLEKKKPEKNSIISKWQELDYRAQDAKDTQALVQLKKIYCDQQQCLSCQIGNQILCRR